MSFERWGYTFEGAFTTCKELDAQSGVYIIWCKNTNGSWTVLDVGESVNVQERVCNHDRANCWKENCNGTIYYSATYTPGLTEIQRRAIESYLRTETNPTCGDK